MGGKPFKNVVLIPTLENVIIALPLKPFEEEVKRKYPHTQTARRDLEKEGFMHIDLTEVLKPKARMPDLSVVFFSITTGRPT